ncbi:hypothetical protein, partial [Trueperella sp. LYQ141]
ASVSGLPPKVGENSPARVEASGSVSVPSEHKPGLSLVKSADKESAGIGDTITYTFTVKNEGNVTVHDIAIKDAMPGVKLAELPKTTLAPGESVETTGTYVVTADDASKASLVNEATAVGSLPDSSTLTVTSEVAKATVKIVVPPPAPTPGKPDQPAVPINPPAKPVPAPGGSGGSLPDTGMHLGNQLRNALLLLFSGIAMLFAGKRRRKDTEV